MFPAEKVHELVRGARWRLPRGSSTSVPRGDLFVTSERWVYAASGGQHFSYSWEETQSVHVCRLGRRTVLMVRTDAVRRNKRAKSSYWFSVPGWGRRALISIRHGMREVGRKLDEDQEQWAPE